MADENRNSGATTEKSTGAKTATLNGGVTEKAGKKAEAAAGHVDRGASKVGSAARSAGEATSSRTQAVGATAKRMGQTAGKGVQAGRQAVVSASSKAASTAATAWTVLKARKIIAAGAGAGLLAVIAGSFAAGRGSAMRRVGPVTRITKGRL